MTDQSPNDAFHSSSFLQGHNAAFMEQLSARYAEDPQAVDESWRRFFAGLPMAVWCRGAQARSRVGVSLTAVSTAALALYDMIKAVDKHASITDMRVLAKSGGKSGSWDIAPQQLPNPEGELRA